MLTIHEEYLTDRSGERKAVLIPISEWQEIIKTLAGLADSRTSGETGRDPSAVSGPAADIAARPDGDRRARLDPIARSDRDRDSRTEGRQAPRFKIARVDRIEIPSREERNARR